MFSVKAALRRTLGRAGYWVSHRSIMPFGIDPIWDIQRLAVRQGIQIRCAFDVGAHAGQTASAFLEAFPAATIHSFEPHPNSFACLDRLRSDRLHTHRLALSDGCGEARFYVYDYGEDSNATVPASMNNSLVQDTQFAIVAGRYEKSISVERVTADSFCAQNGIDRIDLLKIDTEGHEVAVLDGARQTLADRGVSLVFLEFESIVDVPGAVGGALAPAAERLQPLGFRLMATYPVNMIDRPLYAAFNALFLRPPGV